MLLAQKAYAEGSAGLCLYCARLVDAVRHDPDAAARTRSQALLDLLTPVAKAWPSAYGPRANDLAIQILGGYGYTRDFPVEQLYRDNRLNPIHEGTNGIQAIDLLGRKLGQDGGAAWRGLESLIAGECAGSADAAALSSALERLDRSVALAQALPKADAPALLANASAFLDAFGLVVIAWRLLVQARAAAAAAEAGRLAGENARGRAQAFKWFAAVELPRVPVLLDLVDRHDPVAAETDAAWL
jgi:butyryl-CoA dehydrogenase